MRVGNCYSEVGEEYCDDLIGQSVTHSQCCCSGSGMGFSVVEDGIEAECEPCPEENSEDHENLCISGIGYYPNTISMLLEDIDECTLLPGKCEGKGRISRFLTLI